MDGQPAADGRYRDGKKPVKPAPMPPSAPKATPQKAKRKPGEQDHVAAPARASPRRQDGGTTLASPGRALGALAIGGTTDDTVMEGAEAPAILHATGWDSPATDATIQPAAMAKLVALVHAQTPTSAGTVEGEETKVMAQMAEANSYGPAISEEDFFELTTYLEHRNVLEQEERGGVAFLRVLRAPGVGNNGEASLVEP